MEQNSATIAIEEKITPDVLALLRLSDKLFEGLYPAESNHLLDPAELERPEVTFLVARLNGLAVGCGGFVNKVGYGEIKRLFVSAEGRGQKLGWRLMEEIEAQARQAGLAVMKLEMGPSQPEASGLYTALGYEECGPFGEYQPDPYSVFMEKAL